MIFRALMIWWLVSASALALAAQAEPNAANEGDSRTGSALALHAPDNAVAGSLVEVTWNGANYSGAVITVAAPRADAYINRTGIESQHAVSLRLPAAPGDYEIRYVLPQSNRILATEAIRATPIKASVSTRWSAHAGTALEVEWQGPDYPDDYIAVAKQGAANGDYVNATNTSAGHPVTLQMPDSPGAYEIRYVVGQSDRVVAREKITVAPLHATLDALDSAPVGTEIDVFWTGPGLAEDYIAIMGDAEVFAIVRTAKGNPVQLQVPAKPGTYEIRYVSKASHRTIARRRLEATPVHVTLNVPDSVPADSQLEVTWTETPEVDLERHIEVAPVGVARGTGHSASGYGDMIPVQMPGKPGRYEVRFVVSGRVKARQTVEVTPVQVTLKAPETTVAGSVIQVHWSGPGHDWDRVVVAKPGADAGTSIDAEYTNVGSPLRLRMPPEPGQYEIRYILSTLAFSDRIVARKPIRVTQAHARLNVPAKAPAGALVEVEFSGPNNPGDRIVVAAPDAGNEAFINLTGTPQSKPAKLRLPGRPGVYEIRYVTGQAGKILAHKKIKATSVQARLTAPSHASVASGIKVNWQGPGYPFDYIALAAAGSPAGAYISRNFTHKGEPLLFRMPASPGKYEIRYVLTQSDTILAAHDIQVTSE